VPGVGVSTVLQATRQRVFHVEASTRRSRYGQLRIGHHLELHLIDAIRHRAQERVLAEHTAEKRAIQFEDFVGVKTLARECA